MKLLLKSIQIEWKMNTRNFINVFFSLIFPVMMLLLFGSIYGNEPAEYYNGYGSVDVSTAGYLCMIIAVAGLMTLPITLSEYREKKILKRYMATPIKPFDILLSQLVVNAAVTVVGSALLIIIGIIVFNLHFYGNFIVVILAAILIMVAIFSIGLVIAGIAPNSKAALAITYVIYFPMLFLSGATLPLEFMPDVVINISKVLPLTYGVELLKGLWLGGNPGEYLVEILVLLGVAVLFGGTAVKIFKWE